jgi:itaconate CoA-transferase
MYAYTNILAALIHRQTTQRGASIDVSMLESMVEWMGYPLYYAFEGAAPPPRAAAAHATIYPYGPFRSGDGQSVMLGLQNEREWESFCKEVLRQPELIADARFTTNAARAQHRDSLGTIIDQVFSGLTAAEVVSRLESAQIANARVNEMKDVWNHEQLQARGRWTSVQTPAGEIPALLPPGKSSAFNPAIRAIPEVGEHSDALLAELGYSASDISQMRASGVI